MAAIVAALVIALFGAGIGWLLFGNRLHLNPDERQNDILNIGVYAGAIFLVALVLAFIFIQS